MNTKTKILILDDSPDLLDALRIFLEMESFNVCTATSVELFTSEVKRFKPDVIILDIYLRGKTNGREICKIIKSDSTTSHIPVILMSVNVMALKNYEECHADASLDKPFNLSELLQQIKSLAAAASEKVYVKRDNNMLFGVVSKKKHQSKTEIIIPWCNATSPVELYR